MPRPAREAAFFREWSPEMAYVLGYWWADGCMRVKRGTGACELELASVELDHLHRLGATIGGRYQVRRVVQGQDTFAITFCSKQMYHDLLALGGTPHKSRTLTMPAVPDEHLPHFVRGFVDGDGTLTWNGDRPILQIYSASTGFLTGVCEAIQLTTGIPAPNIVANRLLWTVKWSTTRAKCLAAWLYIDNPGLAAPAKLERAHAFLDWVPKKRPEAGTITDAMRLYFADYLTFPGR